MVLLVEFVVRIVTIKIAKDFSKGNYYNAIYHKLKKAFAENIQLTLQVKCNKINVNVILSF